VCDAIIAHMLSGDAKTNRPTDRHRKCKAILGPAGYMFCVRPANKTAWLCLSLAVKCFWLEPGGAFLWC